MTHAIYPGSFDPITLGHVNIIERALDIFERLTVLIAVNPDKEPLFDVAENENLIRAVTSAWPQVDVDHTTGLLVDYCKGRGIRNAVRGLRAVTARLLALPSDQLSAGRRSSLELFAGKLPELPTCEVDGVEMLAAAHVFADERNVENPELYAVFPFRLVSYEKPNAALGVAALHARTHRGYFGWRQDDLFTAYLGLADEAQKALVSRCRHRDHDSLDRGGRNRSRFPGFWGPNYDWYPDQTHGGVLAATIQSMLLQVDGDRIFLCPAWPSDWDADFRLHAPRQTVISGQVRNGKIVSWSITPEHRRSDVTVAGV